MAMATAEGRRPSRAFARAAASLTIARERTSVGKCETGMPVIGKFSTARSVWTPKSASAGTSRSPRRSCSRRTAPEPYPFSGPTARELWYWRRRFMTTATRERTSIAAAASLTRRARTSARGSSRTDSAVRARASVACSDVWRNAPIPTVSPRPSTESGSTTPSLSRDISTLPSRMTYSACLGVPCFQSRVPAGSSRLEAAPARSPRTSSERPEKISVAPSTARTSVTRHLPVPPSGGGRHCREVPTRAAA